MHASRSFGPLVALALLAAASCDPKRGDGSAGSSAALSSSAAASAVAPGATATLPAFDPSQLLLFGPIPKATEEPVVDDAVRLGQLLYLDTRLSGGGDVSCRSCHPLASGGADGAVVSVGSKKQKGRRNTPTVVNAAASFAQGWDARWSTIDELVVPHILEPTVMGMPDARHLVDVVTSIPAYGALFKKAFPDDKPAISAETISRAITAFVKKLFARSRWDRYLEGDTAALSKDELAGVAMFVDAGCTSCHQGKYLGGTQAQKLGIARPWPPPAGADPGRFDVTKQEVDRGLFKVPTLRNVARTGPYLHDGSVASLDEVVRLMGRHQAGRELTPPQVAAIVAFLGTLSGDPPRPLVADLALPERGPKTPPGPSANP